MVNQGHAACFFMEVCSLSLSIAQCVLSVKSNFVGSESPDCTVSAYLLCVHSYYNEQFVFAHGFILKYLKLLLSELCSISIQVKKCVFARQHMKTNRSVTFLPSVFHVWPCRRGVSKGRAMLGGSHAGLSPAERGQSGRAVRRKNSEWFAFEASFPPSTSVLGKSSGLVLVFFFLKLFWQKLFLVSFSFTVKTSFDMFVQHTFQWLFPECALWGGG